MRISYKKLKILMMENQMKRADLVRAAELSPYAAKKINKDEDTFKTIKKDYLNKHAMVSLVREVNILRQLDHPNIVNYFETYEDEQFINIVMEYIPRR